MPLLANWVHTSGNSSSKNWASSIPTTWVLAPNTKIADELSTGVDGTADDFDTAAQLMFTLKIMFVLKHLR